MEYVEGADSRGLFEFEDALPIIVSGDVAGSSGGGCARAGQVVHLEA
jgi:hypothetical protein